ncbi:13478_t:CDS:2 [Funneliformis geosporum]|uniref:14455_t:CDS:1 n=1 Tax=Funneliformis geosporum TaxID=1117311 RepID=A0A9W4SCP8_9GLOM|nr:13478_t:CDS:2 [Funneliformis geosporum]CAI2164482.1 14455_t:CDS:2 [Funneliformis geosporum]
MPKERKTSASKKSSQPKQRKNRRQIHLFETPEFQEKLKRSIDENLEKITQEEGFVFPTNIPLKDLISPCKRTSGRKGKVTRPQNAFILYHSRFDEGVEERFPKPWEPMPRIFKHTPGILQNAPLSTIPSTEIKFYQDTSASSHIIQIQQDNSAEPEYYDSTDSTLTDLKCENEPPEMIMMNYFDEIENATMNPGTLSFDGNQIDSSPEDSSNEEINDFLPTTSNFPFDMQSQLYYSSSIDDSQIYTDQLTTIPSFNDQSSVNNMNNLNALYENDSLQAYNMEFLNGWPDDQLIHNLTLNIHK